MTLTVDAYEKIDNVFVIAPVGKIDITTYAVLEKKIDDILESYPKNLTSTCMRLIISAVPEYGLS